MNGLDRICIQARRLNLVLECGLVISGVGKDRFN